MTRASRSPSSGSRPSLSTAPVRRVPGTAEVVGEVVGRDERGEVWRRWLAEGRFESRAELAEAVGVSRCLVSRVVRGLR